MPISDLGSHVTVGEEVKSHWGAVNASRIAASGTALVLADGYSLANLTTDVASVEAAVSGQEDLDNGVTITAGNRDALRMPLRERVIQFREAVTYRLKGTGYALSLPDTPNEGSSEQKILKALDDVESLWLRINADATVPNFTGHDSGVRLATVKSAPFAVSIEQLEIVTGILKERGPILQARPIRQPVVQDDCGCQGEAAGRDRQGFLTWPGKRP